MDEYVYIAYSLQLLQIFTKYTKAMFYTFMGHYFADIYVSNVWHSLCKLWWFGLWQVTRGLKTYYMFIYLEFAPFKLACGHRRAS